MKHMKHLTETTQGSPADSRAPSRTKSRTNLPPSILSSVLAAALVILLSGCMTITSDVEPDWRSAVRVEELGSVRVARDGGAVMVGSEKDLWLLDGTTGAVVLALEESEWQRRLRGLTIEGFSLGGFYGVAVRYHPPGALRCDPSV